MIPGSNDMIITGNPDRQQWELFVSTHPHGNIFQMPAMFDLYASVPGYTPGVIALQESSGQIQGILCYVMVREPGIKKLVSARSIITGGPLVAGHDIYYATLLLTRYRQLISNTPVIYSQVRNLADTSLLKNAFPEAAFRYDPHLTVHIDLTKPVEQLQNEMHKKRAANIRRALKKNIHVQQISGTAAIETACDLIHKTYNRINIPRPPRDLFLNAPALLGNRILMMGAYTGPTMISCRVYLVFNEQLYDWYAASDLAYASLHPNDLLPWEAMLWGKDHGMKLYDFAGAGKPGKPYGVRDYKLRFGGKLLNFGRYQLIHKPWQYRMGKMGMALYRYFG